VGVQCEVVCVMGVVYQTHMIPSRRTLAESLAYAVQTDPSAFLNYRCDINLPDSHPT
jgi:hypothetical protein